GKTKEVAIENVSADSEVAESVVEEIHREYWQRGRPLFRHRPGSARVEEKFRDYLREAKPERIWAETMRSLDDDETAYFLDMELKTLTRDQRIRIDDLHAIEWTSGRFVESLFGSLTDGQRLE